MPPGVEVFHAGTRLEGGRLVTAGGRVLTVCARRESAAEARAAAFEGVARIRFRGMHFRRDIAAGAG
jgi:phosphoribosylamine--glycine ligase